MTSQTVKFIFGDRVGAILLLMLLALGCASKDHKNEQETAEQMDEAKKSSPIRR